MHKSKPRVSVKRLRSLLATFPLIILTFTASLPAESASVGIRDHYLGSAPLLDPGPDGDIDNDGWPDEEDEFPYDPDEWLDSDLDGIGNNEDPDDDNDGMPDVYEGTYGFNPLIHDGGLDSDQDGSSNIEEYQNVTNPLNLFSCAGQSCQYSAPPAPSQITPPEADTTSDIVGVIAGSLSVSNSGNAEYTIPLYAPAGTAGVAPKLALQYRSNSGNSLLGHGWSMGALSSIARCPQTREQDGVARRVEYDEDDRFCLDGERLVLANPAATYGEDGVEYRTETESFRKIISYGTTGTGPTYFRVWHKDGSVSEYGNSTDSKVLIDSPEAVALWAQNRVESFDSYENAANNPVIYTYWEDSNSGERRIKTIKYAYGNTANSHGALIEFTYENRPNPPSAFLSETLSLRETRLKSIKVSSRNTGGLQEVKKYSLAYLPNNRRNPTSKLSSITECLNSVCLPATQFSWSDADVDYNLTGSSDVEGFSTYPFAGADELQRFAPADFNSDGLNDIIWLEPDGINYRFKASPSNDTTIMTATTQSAAAHAIDAWTVTDYDQDGFPDILFTSNAALYVYLNIEVSGQRSFDDTAIMLIASLDMGTEPALDGPWFDPKGVFADFNADGLIDILYNKAIFYMEADSALTHGPYKFGTAQVITLGDPATSGTLNNLIKDKLSGNKIHFRTIDLDKAIATGDFTRDGIPDLVVDAWFVPTSNVPFLGEKIILQNDGAGNFTYFNKFSQTSNSQDNDRKVLVGDINGDGAADVVFYMESNDYRWKSKISNGKKLADYQNFYRISGANAVDMQLLDITQDGQLDFVYRNESSWNNDDIYALVNNGAGVFAGKSDKIFIAKISGDYLDNHLFMDISGDGITDLVDLDSKAFLGDKASGTSYNKITKITNGLGHETNITYGQLSDPSVYTREFDAPYLDLGYPVFDIQGPITVVASVSSSSPVASDQAYQRTTSYHYQGLKVHPAGRGSLGFRLMETIDEETGIVTTNTYRQDYPFIGLPDSSMTHEESQSTALSETSYSYTMLSHINGTTAPPWLPVFTQSVTTQRVAESDPTASSPAITINGVLTTTTATESNYDSYGNVGTSTVVVAGDGATHTTTTTKTYTNDAESWQLGKLTRSVVTQQQGSSTITRTTDYTYDSDSGFLLTEVREPQGGNDVMLTTTYQYDDFGNPERITETSSYGTRYARTEYDSKGRYIDRTYNSLNQLVSEVVQRDRYGSPEEIHTPNGGVQYLRYGTFGRPFFSATNAGLATTTQYRLCTAVACPTGASYRAQTTGTDGSLQNTYFDKLGREVRSETKSFNGTLALTDIQYDEAGRVKQVSAPYFSGGTVYWNTTDYDNLGRTIKVVDANSGVSTNHFSRYVDGSIVGIQQVSTNQLSQSKTTVTNGRGQTLKVVDDLDGYINYTYDPTGNLTALDSNGVESDITYDILGRRVGLDDPDQGEWSYVYNAFGEMTQQTDSTGAKTIIEYDSLGRMEERQDKRPNQSLESNTVWEYGTNAAANEQGQLVMEQDLISDYIKVYFYDDLGRPRRTITSLGVDGVDGDFSEYQSYDQYGRVFQQIDATLKGVEHQYNANGYLEKLLEATNTSLVYHTVTQTNARGQVTAESMLGTQFQMGRGYDAKTGLATSIVATSSQYSVTPSGSTLLDLELEFDDVGNLISRTREVGATSTLASKTLSETFSYDQLNRLTSIAATGHATQTLTYDLTGNILSKTGIGSYSYGAGSAGPHAVTSAGGDTYTYDAIGNMLTGGGRTAAYNAFRKPVEVSKGSHTTSFVYAPDRQHYKRVDDDGSTLTTTLTVGSVELIQEGSNPLKTKRYIGGVVVVTDTLSSHEQAVLLTDHLGSTVAIANPTTLALEQLDYDAFGKRRSLWTLAELAQGELSQVNLLTTTGFTGHEMLDEVGLIHMQGRVYDPGLGRFLSADPYITELDNTQNFNRYSYVYNNPLTLVDPSGFAADQIGEDGVCYSNNCVEIFVFGEKQSSAASYFGSIEFTGLGLMDFTTSSTWGDGAGGGNSDTVTQIPYKPAVNVATPTQRTDVTTATLSTSIKVAPGLHSASDKVYGPVVDAKLVSDAQESNATLEFNPSILGIPITHLSLRYQLFVQSSISQADDAAKFILQEVDIWATRAGALGAGISALEIGVHAINGDYIEASRSTADLAVAGSLATFGLPGTVGAATYFGARQTGVFDATAPMLGGAACSAVGGCFTGFNSNGDAEISRGWYGDAKDFIGGLFD